MITQIEFDEWKESDVTRSFFEALKNEREELKEGLIHGLYSEPLDVIGRASAIENIVSMSYHDLVESLRKE